MLAIQRQPDANTVTVVDLVRERLPSYRAQIPAAVQMEVLNDRSISIRDSVDDVQETLLIAIGLVVLVIFLFLRSVSATIIPALAVPISLIATCAAMYAFGFSINNMTLLALTLSVGFVVDDAIVMLENIVRHIEGGMRPFEAALKGSREIGFTIVSITLLADRRVHPGAADGRHGRPRVPRVRGDDRGRHHPVRLRLADADADAVRARAQGASRGRAAELHPARRSRRCSKPACAPTRRRSTWRLKYKFVMIVTTVVTMIGTVYLYIAIPKGFFPTEDTGFISATVEGPSDISFKAMYDRQQQIAEIVRQDKAVDYVNSTVGTGGPNPTNNYGRLFIALKPRAERGENSSPR